MLDTITITTYGDCRKSLEKLIQYLILTKGKGPEFFLDEGARPLITKIDPKLKIVGATVSRDLTQFNADKFDDVLDLPKEKYIYVYDVTKIELENPDSLFPLIFFLQHLGTVGSSRGIAVKSHKGNFVGLFGWDGDGADRISELELNGKKLKPSKDDDKKAERILYGSLRDRVLAGYYRGKYLFPNKRAATDRLIRPRR